MPDLMTGPDLMDRLAKAFRTDRRGRFAVAFWGAGAAARIGIKKNDDVEVICNLPQGGTNPAEIERLMKLGVKVRQHSRLHAKIGITGDLSFVGSSNMSTNGLGVEGDETAGWEEANIVCAGDPFDVASRFRALWKDARTILPEDLKQAKVEWKKNRRTRARLSIGKAGTSLLKILRNDPQSLDAANIHAAVAMPATAKEEKAIKEVVEDVREQFDDSFDVYLGWPTLPKDAYLVDFTRTEEEGTTYEKNLYRRSGEIEDKKKGRKTFEVVKKIPDIHGLKVSPADGRILADAVERYMLEHGIEYGEAKDIPIAKLAPFLKDPTTRKAR